MAAWIFFPQFQGMEEEGGRSRVSAWGISLSPKFPEAMYIPLSSFHNPISLHGEERGIKNIKMIHFGPGTHSVLSSYPRKDK